MITFQQAAYRAPERQIEASFRADLGRLYRRIRDPNSPTFRRQFEELYARSLKAHAATSREVAPDPAGTSPWARAAFNGRLGGREPSELSMRIRAAILLALQDGPMTTGAAIRFSQASGWIPEGITNKQWWNQCAAVKGSGYIVCTTSKGGRKATWRLTDKGKRAARDKVYGDIVERVEENGKTVNE